MTAPDIIQTLSDTAMNAAERQRSPEGVAVLVASRDAAVIAKAAPHVARELYGHGWRYGRIIHTEPILDPDNPAGALAPGQWSEVIVEVLP